MYNRTMDLIMDLIRVLDEDQETRLQGTDLE